MMHFADHLLRAYGLGAITFGVAVECAGMPFPGETLFFAAAVYASTTGRLSIFAVIGAAVAGAILGNLVGFGVGRWVGAPVLARYGWRVGLTERRLMLGRYLFRVHGGKVVFFCRFVSVLRSAGALLAGASAMRFWPFLGWTVAGGVAWPVLHGAVAYALGGAARGMSWPLRVALALATVGVVVWVLRFVKRNEVRLEAAALRSDQLERHG